MSYIYDVNQKEVLGDLRNAKELLIEAVEISPNFYVYHERLGDIFRLEGQRQKAQKCYEQALKINPEALWLPKKIEKLLISSSDILKTVPQKRFCGIYQFYPNLTGQRQAEGGLRLKGILKSSTKNLPLVTIVTVVYNNSDNFQRCIDSVSSQKYGNIEYIVIDGGSEKPTLDLIFKNETKIDYFISEPDKGIYSAMNKGIRLARGEYISLLNSDDFYEPSFVEKTINQVRMQNHCVDIVYTDYRQGGRILSAQEINDGVLFGHLNICHNTFLVSRDCYDRIGPYDEKLKIISDAVWIRSAFCKGTSFHCLSEPLFTLSEGGLSSGSTETHRNLFIKEVVQSYRQIFPQLSEADAEEIYLFRFNKARTSSLIKVAENYLDNPEIMCALRCYVEHCMRDRDNFQLARNEVTSLFADFVRLAEIISVDKHCFQIATKQGPLRDVLRHIDEKIRKTKTSANKIVLHFITVFSAPPETFVYDLLKRLEAHEEYDNFVLFEHAQLQKERPYEKAIQVFWNDFEEPIAQQLYKYIVDQLKPDVLIAHFALNEWKWAQRIKDLNIKIPTITMCHGIDVFALKDQAEYKDYVINDFARRDCTAFTVVSDYLRQELIANGVAPERIHLLPNTVNDRFFKHRKTERFYDRSRKLLLLCIGRLVEWKGHRYLIEALQCFRDLCTKNFHLTLIYGNTADELENLRNQVSLLGLEKHVTFKPYIDFGENPDYLSGFDCYVHPSTYSNKPYRSSETFGVAVLEAITAGLPVITTDAGGLPEVVGESGQHARIVPHSDAKALFKALADFWQDGTAFTDNRTFAEQKLMQFSAESQLFELGRLIDKVTTPHIRAAIISSSTIQGAGYAAFRVHKGLRSTDIESHMFTTVQNHENEPDLTVVQHPLGDSKCWTALQVSPKPGLTISTINQTHIPSRDLLRLMEPFDIVNVHWYARFLSAENIAALTHSGKPIILTIRDMMPITGGCHCFHGCEKWRIDCSDCPQMPISYKDYPKKVLATKRENYNFSNLTLVALSTHTLNILEKVPFFRDCRIELIPNSIETDVFRPYDQATARKEFDLPENCKIIGYIPSYSSKVKGYRELSAALKLLDNSTDDINHFVMLVGSETPLDTSIGFDRKALGYISNKRKLAMAYSAADVVVVPSLEETFSNTTAEAISCGTPVVGFKTGAIPDLVLDGKTGYTYDVGDVEGIATGIMKVLNGNDMSYACRKHAENFLSFSIQAGKYRQLIKDLLDNKKR